MSQERKIDLLKEFYSKADYEKVINTSFSELGVPSVSASAEETISVEQFFGYYNDIFYDIPPTGESDSHEFLVRSSGEYINADTIALKIITFVLCCSKNIIYYIDNLMSANYINYCVNIYLQPLNNFIYFN